MIELVEWLWLGHSTLDSASSQFFIDLGPQAFLNQKASAPGSGYAVFGQVIEGMEVVYKIMNENVPPKPGSDGTANLCILNLLV